jgi:surface antigen
MSQQPMSLLRVHLRRPAGTHLEQPAAAAPRVQAGRPALFLAAGYLALLAAAEVLAAFTAAAVAWLGPLAYGVVLLLFVLHTALCWDRPLRCLPAILSGAPVLRLALLLLAPAGAPLPYRCLALGLPVLAAGGAMLYILDILPSPGVLWPPLRAGLVRIAEAGGRIRALRPLLWGFWLPLKVRLVHVAEIGRRIRGLLLPLRARLATLGSQVFVLPALVLLLAIGVGLGGGHREGDLLAGSGSAAAGRPGASPVHVLPLGIALGRYAGCTWGDRAAERSLLSGAAAAVESAVTRLGVGERLARYAPAPLLPTRLLPGLPLARAGAVLPGDELRPPAGRPPRQFLLPPTSPAEPEALFPDCPGRTYENYYPRAVCTWYAKEKRPDLPWFEDDDGMALNWPRAARLCGFQVDGEPAAGAVAVFPPGANGAFEAGHVAYVEEVTSDSVLISECNVDHASAYIVPGSRWWEAGYPCAYRRIPLERLHPGVLYIHGRAGPTRQLGRPCL